MNSLQLKGRTQKSFISTLKELPIDSTTLLRYTCENPPTLEELWLELEGYTYAPTELILHILPEISKTKPELIPALISKLDNLQKILLEDEYSDKKNNTRIGKIIRQSTLKNRKKILDDSQYTFRKPTYLQEDITIKLEDEQTIIENKYEQLKFLIEQRIMQYPTKFTIIQKEKKRSMNPFTGEYEYDPVGNTECIIGLYASLTKKEKEKIHPEIKKLIQNNIFRSEESRFNLIIQLIKNNMLKTEVTELEQPVAQGYSSEPVTRFQVLKKDIEHIITEDTHAQPGELNNRYILKYHLANKKNRKKIDLETKIYNRLGSYYTTLEVHDLIRQTGLFEEHYPTRLMEFETKINNKKHLVTVNTHLFGETLNDIEPSKEILQIIKAITIQLQYGLKKVLSVEDYKTIHDPYLHKIQYISTSGDNTQPGCECVGGVYLFDKKMKDSFTKMGIQTTKKQFKTLMDILNDEKVISKRTITIDINPGNIIISEPRIHYDDGYIPITILGLFDFCGLRYQLPHDDWVQLIDFPKFISDKDKSKTINLFLNKQRNENTLENYLKGMYEEGDPIPPEAKTLNKKTNYRIFHAMAVYRNIRQMSTRYELSKSQDNSSKSLDDARHFYHRAMMSAKELGLENIIPKEQIEYNLGI